MSFSYNATLNRTLDLVRFVLGDTDSTAALFQDEEINGIISLEGDDANRVGAYLAGVLARRYAGRANVTIEGLSIDWQARAEQWRELATTLTAGVGNASGGIAGPIVSGLTRTEIRDLAGDPDSYAQAVVPGSAGFLEQRLMPDVGSE